MALLAMFVKRRNTCIKIQEFPVLYDKRVKGFKNRYDTKCQGENCRKVKFC